MVIPLFSDGDVKLGLIKMMLDHPEWTRILAYCNTIHEAVTFNTLCNKLGVISETFDGSTPVRDRKASIRRLESGETRVLTTVQTINEGTDIPSADTCMFVEPRNGHVTVTQCVGRVLRKCAATGKTVATVVLPTVDEERELVRFMRVMIKSDTRIGGDAWKSGGRSTIICDTGDIESATLLSESMYDRLGNVINGAWSEKYSVLQSYVDANGCLPKQSTVCDDIKIGNWCNKQRQSHKKGKLSAERIAILEAVPGWYWFEKVAKIIRTWDETFQVLQSYDDENTCLPKRSAVFDDIKIGSWCNTQRRSHKKGKLSTERIAKLEAVPGWYWTEKVAKIIRTWEEKFQE
jgi:superfamily II DNA/RNA helicase